MKVFPIVCIQNVSLKLLTMSDEVPFKSGTSVGCFLSMMHEKGCHVCILDIECQVTPLGNISPTFVSNGRECMLFRHFQAMAISTLSCMSHWICGVVPIQTLETGHHLP